MDEKINKEIKNDNTDKESEKDKDNFVPEQLEDDDFEKEKEKIKAEKAAKKAERKAKKMKKNEFDENGEPVKKKKSNKITIIIIIVLILAIIIGVIGYLILAINKPENAIKDWASYVSQGSYTEASNLMDMQGYLAMLLIQTEATADNKTSDDSNYDSNSNNVNVSYADYDNRYDNAISDLEKKFKDQGYTFDVNSVLEYGNNNIEEIYKDIFENYSINVNSIDSVERIGKTSLYKISANITISDKTGSQADEAAIYEMYVSKKDGNFKIVGGKFSELIFSYEYYYSSYSSLQGQLNSSSNTTEADTTTTAE